VERGQPVHVRGRHIGALLARRVLDSESNLCFGGALERKPPLFLLLYMLRSRVSNCFPCSMLYPLVSMRPLSLSLSLCVCVCLFVCLFVRMCVCVCVFFPITLPCVFFSSMVWHCFFRGGCGNLERWQAHHQNRPQLRCGEANRSFFFSFEC
jgi:hypothetical protein